MFRTLVIRDKFEHAKITRSTVCQMAASCLLIVIDNISFYSMSCIQKNMPCAEA